MRKIALVGALCLASTCSMMAQSAPWWKGFEDPLLDSLVYRGRRDNGDMAAAAYRIESAKSNVRRAEAGYYPKLGVSTGYERSNQGNAYSAAASLSWEIDLFGKVRAQVRQADAQLRLSAAEAGAVMLSLDASITQAYIGLMTARTQLAIAARHAQNQTKIMKITEVRYETGLASKLDVAQARMLYYSTIAQVPMLEGEIKSDVNSLSVLLGCQPEQLPAALDTASTIPPHFHLQVFDIPADAVRNRPDVAQAEASVDAAAAALGIAKKDYLPSLSLVANGATADRSIKNLFSGGSYTYSIAPTISWTVFDGLARRNALVGARADLEAQVQKYNMTVLSAMQEINNAIITYRANLEYIARMEEVLAACEVAVDKSIELYKQGLTQFSNVVDAQQNSLSYQNSYVAAKEQALLSLVNLYKALGGDWGLNQDK